MLGDNAYSNGTDAEYQSAVFNMYPNMLKKSVLWPAFGNHDGYSANSDNQTGVFYDIFTLPANAEAGGSASGTEAYYSFDYANIHFICLNSHDIDRSVTGKMCSWLQNDLVVVQKRVLVNSTPDISSSNVISNLHQWLEVPALLSVQRGNCNTTRDVNTVGSFGNLCKWSLNTIVDSFHQTRSQLDRQRLSSSNNGVSNGNTSFQTLATSDQIIKYAIPVSS